MLRHRPHRRQQCSGATIAPAAAAIAHEQKISGGLAATRRAAGYAAGAAPGTAAAHGIGARGIGNRRAAGIVRHPGDTAFCVRSLHAGDSVGLPASRRRGAVDPARARAAESLPPENIEVTWEVARDEQVPRYRAPRHRAGRAGARAQRARRAAGLEPGALTGTASRARRAVSAAGRTRTAPAADAASDAALRVRLLPAIRAGLLRRLSPHGGARTSISWCSSATTSTSRRGAATACASTTAASRARSTTTAPATRCTKAIPTCSARTRPHPGS